MPRRALAGIYQICSRSTNKVYVGSSVDMHARWQQHRHELRRSTHGNRHLQAAWQKYGEADFEFAIVEFVERALLYQREEYWIATKCSADRKYGYNIFDTAGSPGEAFAHTWEGFIDPEGNEVIITNLEGFCQRNGLSTKVMRNLAIGKRNRGHKGWTHQNSIRQREYIKIYEGFIDPNGNEIETITNLAKFCRQHELDNTHMIAVLHGRICSHRGWTHRGDRKQEYKTYTGFFDPKGEHFTITNLAAFCRENRLHPVKMRQVKSGIVRSHRGWTWKETNDHGK